MRLAPADPARQPAWTRRRATRRLADIARLCGYLPLAMGMLARQLHHHPAWTAADLAADLTAARDRLELMSTENLSVAAAFDLSYQDLSEDQQRLFRRLGLHPGIDIDAYAVAALNGIELRPPGAIWRPCTTITCSPNPPAASTGCMTSSMNMPAP